MDEDADGGILERVVGEGERAVGPGGAIDADGRDGDRGQGRWIDGDGVVREGGAVDAFDTYACCQRAGAGADACDGVVGNIGVGGGVMFELVIFGQHNTEDAGIGDGVVGDAIVRAIDADA